MDGRQVIQDLVTAVAPSATVMGIDEEQGAYRVRVETALRRCADRVVAAVPDGRA